MRLNKPVRILLIVFLVVFLLGGFAFQTYLFNPFEGDYEADVATLVPRDVDFFLAKAELDRDFGEFPRLRVAEKLEGTKAWRTFERVEYPGLDEQYGISASLAGIEDLMAQLRGLDLLSIVGGEDVAVAGYFRGVGMEQADWAAYARVNWMGKIGVSALRFPSLIGLEAQGISAAVEDDHVALSGGQLQRELFIARLRDVAVVGTSLELIRKALELDARKGVDSFGQSASYFDHIENADRGPRHSEVELYFDWRAWSENNKLGGRWPDPDSQDYTPRLLARLFQAGSLRNLAGVLGFDRGVALDLHGELSSEVMTTVQKKIYRQRGVEQVWFSRNVARMVRADAGLLLYLQVDIGDLMREMFAAADPATRSNLDDLVRSLKADQGFGPFNGADDLIDELGKLFKDRVALVVRENTHVQQAQAASGGGERADPDPPHNDEPVAAIAVMLWTDGTREAQAKIEAIHQVVSHNQGRFALQGLDGGSGVWHHPISTGHDVWEFWSMLVDGTGHIAAAVDYDRYLISNHYGMIEDMMRVFGKGGSAYPRLSERPEFRELIEEGLDQANAVVWVDPKSLAAINAPFNQRNAEFLVLDNVDWELERANEEARVVREQFPNQARGALDAATQAKVNAIVGPKLTALRDRLMNEQVPAIRAEMERRDLYLSAMSGLLVMLSLDQKHFDLKAQALMLLEE